MSDKPKINPDILKPREPGDKPSHSELGTPAENARIKAFNEANPNQWHSAEGCFAIVDKTVELAYDPKGRVNAQVPVEHPLSNTPDGWLAAGKKIASLPLDKQAIIIGSGILAGLSQHNFEQRERDWGALIGSIQGAGNVAVNLTKITDFSGYCIKGDRENAAKMADEFGTALGETIVSGIRLYQSTDKYLFDLGYSGDFAKPVKDLVATGAFLNERWNQLSPRDQDRQKYKLITELAGDGIVGASGAQAIGKAKKFTEVLDAVAEHTVTATGHSLEASKKAVRSISHAVDSLLTPEFATPDGQRIRTSRQLIENEADTAQTHMMESKSDDLGETAGGKQSFRIDAVTRRLQRTDLGKVREPYNWEVISERFSPDAVRQTKDDSCISAVGEMLSGGQLSEKHLIDKLGTPGNIDALAVELGNGWTSKKRSFNTLSEISKHGSWAAEMNEYNWTKFSKTLHAVAVDGHSPTGNIIIRDPLEGTRYEMTVKDFLRTWTGRAAYRWYE